LAATLLPLSSEVALWAAIAQGVSPMAAVVVASLGNVLAIVVNYILGYFLYEKMEQKIAHSKAYKIAKRYGIYSLWLSFLPVIGDPLTIAAGIFRIPFFTFFLIAGILRIVRYVIIVFFLS